MHNERDQDSSVAGVAGDAGVSFSTSEHDRVLIRSIVARAFRDRELRRVLDFIEEGEPDARQALTMDLTACHANGCPIDLAKLLDADDVTFGHDITGIQRHIDRRTGRLRRAFGPRTMMTDDQRKERERIADAAARNMKDLIAAAEHAGATRVHLENAKRQEEAAARKRKADNTRRRKARNARKGQARADVERLGTGKKDVVRKTPNRSARPAGRDNRNPSRTTPQTRKGPGRTRRRK